MSASFTEFQDGPFLCLAGDILKDPPAFLSSCALQLCLPWDSHQSPAEDVVCSTEVLGPSSATALPHSLQGLGLHFFMVTAVKADTDYPIPDQFLLVCNIQIQKSILIGPSETCAKKLSLKPSRKLLDCFHPSVCPSSECQAD